MAPKIRREFPVQRSSRGFTIVEFVIVIAIIAIIASIAAPSVISWRSSLNASQSAKNMVDTLREARSKAITTNFQHEVVFDVTNHKYQVLKGTQSYNTPPTPANPANGWTTVVMDWIQLSNGLTVASGSGCNSTSNVNVQFNADGTARLETPPGTASSAPVTICVQGGNGEKMHTIVVTEPGRITLD